MNAKILRLKARLNLLQQRDPAANANIINKIRRRLRLLESE